MGRCVLLCEFVFCDEQPWGISVNGVTSALLHTSGARWESDGVVVPLIVVRDITGGKDPDFGHVDGEGTCEGMADTGRSNYPNGRESTDKVRHLQRRLWAAAKQSPERRSHALDDPIHRIWRYL